MTTYPVFDGHRIGDGYLEVGWRPRLGSPEVTAYSATAVRVLVDSS